MIALLIALAIQTARPAPVVADPMPVIYLTTDSPAPVLVFDKYGNGIDIFWTAAGQTVQASIHVVADGYDWLYIHDDRGRSGWVKYNYDTMRVRFDYATS